MSKAIVLREHGGAEALQLEDVAVPEPGPGELQIRQTAIGVNFHDIYVRSGLYKTLPLPGIPGIEAVGVVEGIGSDVSEFEVGGRIGYVTNEYGAYAQIRNLPAKRAIPLPGDIDDRLAASILLKGLTVQMLVEEAHKIRPGETVLVHAAAGAVGQMLTRWAIHLGAEVIGTVGSEAKAETARQAGCKSVILYRTENFREKVSEYTNGKGVDAVYDSVGKDTFFDSLECLKVGGDLVAFGQSSGNVEPFTLAQLAKKSLSVRRPIIFHYTDDRARCLRMAHELFAAIRGGFAKTDISLEFSLANAAEAHRRMEARATSGATILLP